MDEERKNQICMETFGVPSDVMMTCLAGVCLMLKKDRGDIEDLLIREMEGSTMLVILFTDNTWSGIEVPKGLNGQPFSEQQAEEIAMKAIMKAAGIGDFGG